MRTGSEGTVLVKCGVKSDFARSQGLPGCARKWCETSETFTARRGGAMYVIRFHPRFPPIVPRRLKLLLFFIYLFFIINPNSSRTFTSRSIVRLIRGERDTISLKHTHTHTHVSFVRSLPIIGTRATKEPLFRNVLSLGGYRVRFAATIEKNVRRENAEASR